MYKNTRKDEIFIEFINFLSEKDKKGFENLLELSILRKKFLYNLPILREIFKLINYLIISSRINKKIYLYKTLLLFDREDNFIIQKIDNLEELKFNKFKVALLNIFKYLQFKKSLNNLTILKEKNKINNIDNYLLFFYYLDFKSNFFLIINIVKNIKGKFYRFACPNEYTAEFLGIISGLKSIDFEFILLSLRRSNFIKMNHPIKYIDYHVSLFIDYLYFIKNRKYDQNIYISRINKNKKMKKLERENIKLGFFLASYYDLDIEELEYLTDNKISIEIQKILNKYQPSNYILFAHPNDKRIINILKRKNFNVFNGINRIDEINKLNLAIIGNTSAGDLLNDRQISVLYSNKLDKYDFDYFGYIRENIFLDNSEKLFSIEEINNFYINKVSNAYQSIQFKIVQNINQALDIYSL